MIVDAIVSALSAVVEWALSLFPSISWPGWLTGSGSGSVLGTASSLAQSLGEVTRWFPFDVFVSCMAGLAALVLVALGVRAVRFIISIVTLGGGD